MDEPIKLYFDGVTPDGLHGQTFNGEKVLHNLHIIDSVYYEEYMDTLLNKEGATLFLPTGRFISVLTASIDNGNKLAFMSSFDLKNNLDGAVFLAKQNPETYVEFMKAFRKIEYEKDYNKFILVEGELPENS